MSIRFNAFQFLTEGVFVVLIVYLSSPNRIYAKVRKMELWVEGGAIPLPESIRGAIVVLLITVLIFLVFASVVPYVYKRMLEVQQKHSLKRRS